MYILNLANVICQLYLNKVGKNLFNLQEKLQHHESDLYKMKRNIYHLSKKNWNRLCLKEFKIFCAWI